MKSHVSLLLLPLLLCIPPPGCGGTVTHVSTTQQQAALDMCERLTTCSLADARLQGGFVEEDLLHLRPQLTAACTATYGGDQMLSGQVSLVRNCSAKNAGCVRFAACLTPLTAKQQSTIPPSATEELPAYLSEAGASEITLRARHKLTPEEPVAVIQEREDSLLVLLPESGFRLSLDVPVDQFFRVTRTLTSVVPRADDGQSDSIFRAIVSLPAGMALNDTLTDDESDDEGVSFIRYRSHDVSFWGKLLNEALGVTYLPAEWSDDKGDAIVVRLPASILSEPGGEIFARLHTPDPVVPTASDDAPLPELDATSLGVRRGNFELVSIPIEMDSPLLPTIAIKGWIRRDLLSRSVGWHTASGHGAMRGRQACRADGLAKGTRLYDSPNGAVVGVVHGDCVRFLEVDNGNAWVAATVRHQLGESVVWYMHPPSPNPLEGRLFLSGTSDELWTLLFRDGRLLWKEESFEMAIALFERIIETRPDLDVARYSANLVIDMLIRSKKWEELRRFIKALDASAVLLQIHPKLRQHLVKLRQRL